MLLNPVYRAMAAHVLCLCGGYLTLPSPACIWLPQQQILLTISHSGLHGSEPISSAEHAGAVAYLAPLVLNQDPKLKRQVCCALAQIAKHSVDMAEVVVEAEVFPKILTCLKFPDELVRKHAATVVREVSYVTPSRTV